MPRLSRVRRIKRIIYSKPVVFILLILAVVIGRATWSAYINMSETGSEATQIQDRQEKLLDKREVLEQNIARLETEEGIEEELRERFGAAKKGEQMVVIVSEGVESDQEGSEESPWWTRFIPFYGD